MKSDRQTQAAAQLEEIAIATKEVIRRLHEGQSPELAYALVYELRWRVGKVVTRLGAPGVPRKPVWDAAKDIIDSQVWEGQASHD